MLGWLLSLQVSQPDFMALCSVPFPQYSNTILLPAPAAVLPYLPPPSHILRPQTLSAGPAPAHQTHIRFLLIQHTLNGDLSIEIHAQPQAVSNSDAPRTRIRQKFCKVVDL